MKEKALRPVSKNQRTSVRVDEPLMSVGLLYSKVTRFFPVNPGTLQVPTKEMDFFQGTDL